MPRPCHQSKSGRRRQHAGTRPRLSKNLVWEAHASRTPTGRPGWRRHMQTGGLKGRDSRGCGCEVGTREDEGERGKARESDCTCKEEETVCAQPACAASVLRSHKHTHPKRINTQLCRTTGVTKGRYADTHRGGVNKRGVQGEGGGGHTSRHQRATGEGVSPTNTTCTRTHTTHRQPHTGATHM